MKRILFPILAVLALAVNTSKATDFHFQCEWIVDGEVASSVEVERFQMHNGYIEVLVPETKDTPATHASFRFDEERVGVDLKHVSPDLIEATEEKKARGQTLFDSYISFEMGKETTIFTTKVGETSKSFVFTVTPPEDWVSDDNGQPQLTDEEIGKLDYSFSFSGTSAYLTIHNGNPFAISHALVRIKNKPSDSESELNLVYSVHLGIEAFSDEFTQINDSRPLPKQEYEITLESAYR